MSGQTVFLVRMSAFLAAAAVVAAVLHQNILAAFANNPVLNALILVVLLIGIGYSYRQVFMISRESDWMLQWQRALRTSAAPPRGKATLLAPMAKLLENRTARGTISAPAMRSLLDGLASRLDETREISRYLTGLLIFLGLLGTFWGLLITVGGVSETIAGLTVSSDADFVQLFERLKRGLEEPLEGMGTAFSTSMFGLAGSLILGFLDLQAGQAQNRFYNELEEWLSGFTRISGSSGSLVDGDASVPAYVQALLEQTAESIDNLQRTMARSEETRSGSGTALVQLADRLSLLTDQMRAEQALLVKLTEQQMELRPVLQRLADARPQGGGMDDVSRNHLRNLDIHAARMVEEMTTGRDRLTEEIRTEIKLLARTIAALADNSRR